MKQLLIALFSLVSLTLAQAQITAPSGGNAAAADAKATTALSAAASATATANAALSAAGSVTATVATHTTQITSVSTAASSAITAAGSATTTANTALNTANSANATAGALATQVGSATTTANNALNTANTALSAANSATAAAAGKASLTGANFTGPLTAPTATTNTATNDVATTLYTRNELQRWFKDTLSTFVAPFDSVYFKLIDRGGTSIISPIVSAWPSSTAVGGGSVTVDQSLSTSSSNAVSNVAVTAALNTLIGATLTPAITGFSASNVTTTGLTLSWASTQKGVTPGDLLGFMPFVQVNTYQDAATLAVGTIPKRIRVTATHETYEYWPDSTATDKLELIVTN